MTTTPLRASAIAMIALAIHLLPSAPHAQAISIDAVADTWIRENNPQSSYDDDLISIWAADVENDQRYGVVMFDLSSVVGPITSAYLELYDRNDSRSRTSAITQQAFILQTAPPEIVGYTWEEYFAFDKASEAALTGLGAYNIPARDLLDGFEPSQLATAGDLSLLQSVRTSQAGKVAFILKATAGARDWGDIEYDDAPPRLVLNEPLPVYGDFTGDHQVNAADFAFLINPANWLQDVTLGAPGDINADGHINLKDFSLFKPVYLAANPGASLTSLPVPEPAAFSLALVGLLVVRSARRRRRIVCCQ